MAMYTLNLLAIALELAVEEPAYEDVASKFWEHFIYIAHAMSHRGRDGMGLWNEEDGFFYDVLKLPDGGHFPMKIRSMVGLIPLFAVETLEPEMLDKLPDFKTPPGVVHRKPSGPDGKHREHERRGSGRAQAALDRGRGPAAQQSSSLC